MRLIICLTHIQPQAAHNIAERIATRAIVLKGDQILLLYTRRYNDYSLPGGGVEEGETLLLETIVSECLTTCTA